MIYRFMFVGYAKNIWDVKCIQDMQCYTALSHKGNMVFMYVESNKKEVNPNLLAEGDMIPYPNGKLWERAIEIFHYSRPVTEEQWKRKLNDKEPYVTFNRLRPELTARYIFYHYQLQEEHPGGSDRYGVIYLFQDMLIFYHELPKEPETDCLEGSLKTKQSPLEHWSEMMEEHFLDRWKEIENLDFTEYINF